VLVDAPTPPTARLIPQQHPGITAFFSQRRTVNNPRRAGADLFVFNPGRKSRLYIRAGVYPWCSDLPSLLPHPM